MKNHSDQLILISIFFFFFRPRPTTDVHNLIKPASWLHPSIRGPRIMPDLVCTHFFARFVLFHFSSLSAFISVISISAKIRRRQEREQAFLFWLTHFTEKNIKYKLRCASARLVAASKASSKVGKSS